MSLSEIIALGAAGLAWYFYKESSDLEAQRKKDREDHAEYVAELLRENSDLQDKIDPNLGAYQSPILFSVVMRSGGQMLENNEIVLNCTNPTNNIVELRDFQAVLWIAGYWADMCVPSNTTGIKIPANSTVSIRLYAKYGQLFRKEAEVKRAINLMYDGTDSTFMRKNTYIPLEDAPVMLNMQYLWVGKGFEDECFAYNIPGSFRWKYAGWIHGASVGYNSAKEKEREKNPSHWEDTKKIESADE